jgi:hypothetical protein
MLLPQHVSVIRPSSSGIQYPLDDGRMTEACCGNNIGREEEELLRWRTHNCFVLFYAEDGSDVNLRNVVWPSMDYTALHRRFTSLPSSASNNTKMLKMEATWTFETSGDLQWITKRFIQEDRTIHYMLPSDALKILTYQSRNSIRSEWAMPVRHHRHDQGNMGPQMAATINYGRAPLGAPPHVTLTQPSH